MSYKIPATSRQILLAWEDWDAKGIDEVQKRLQTAKQIDELQLAASMANLLASPILARIFNDKRLKTEHTPTVKTNNSAGAGGKCDAATRGDLLEKFLGISSSSAGKFFLLASFFGVTTACFKAKESLSQMFSLKLSSKVPPMSVVRRTGVRINHPHGNDVGNDPFSQFLAKRSVA